MKMCLLYTLHEFHIKGHDAVAADHLNADHISCIVFLEETCEVIHLRDRDIVDTYYAVPCL